MPSLNIVVVLGNLTRDPELRHTKGGTPVASLSVAVNNRTKSASGEWSDDPCFIDVSVFDQQAERCGEHLAKGSTVLVEGRLSQRRWEKGGQKFSKHEITAFRVQFVPKGSRGPEREPGADDVPF